MMIGVKARRGDGVAWRSTVSYCGDVSGPTVYYRLGRVTSITREGTVKRAEHCFWPGAGLVIEDGPLLPHFRSEADLRFIECYIFPADKFDIDAMLDAYATEALDLSGRTDGGALYKLRAFVARFRRDGR